MVKGTPVFQRTLGRPRVGISSERPQRNMLILLLATCEEALEKFGRPDVRVDDRLVRDLQRVIEGTRTELDALEK